MKFDSFLALGIRVENENSLFGDNAVCHGNREPFLRDAIRESATVDEGENRIIRGKDASKISRHIAGKSRVASERARSSHDDDPINFRSCDASDPKCFYILQIFDIYIVICKYCFRKLSEPIVFRAFVVSRLEIMKFIRALRGSLEFEFYFLLSRFHQFPGE